jgi:hypothetical protein
VGVGDTYTFKQNLNDIDTTSLIEGIPLGESGYVLFSGGKASFTFQGTLSSDIAFVSFLPSVFSGYEADVLLCVVGLALLVYTFGAVPSMGVLSAGWYVTDLSTLVESIEPPEVTLPDDESQVAISFEKLTSLFQFEPDLTEGYSPVTVNALKIFLKMRKSATHLFAYTTVKDEELENLFLEGDETSGLESLEYMFYNCHYMHNIPWFDTSSVTNVNNMFGACQYLHVVPALDFRNVTFTGGIFTRARIRSIFAFARERSPPSHSIFASASTKSTSARRIIGKSNSSS